MNKTIRQAFERLDSRRQPLMTRWREFSELAIPALLPRNGFSETSELPVPYSSATARGCTRLASRLASTLVPLNGIPFFNLDLDDGEPVEGSDPTEIQKVLSRIERRVMRKLELTNFREAVYAALIHMIVLGNALLVANDNYNYTLYRVDKYVIRRRMDGEWHEIIIRDFIDPSMPPQILIDNGFQPEEEKEGYCYGKDAEDAIYTRVVNNHKGGCTVEREYRGKRLEKGGGEYKVCPYIPLRWTLVDGENYGRGLIEDNLGDIRCLEAMAEALLDSMMANAEYRFGVNPAGITEIHDLQESENGTFVPAQQSDVFPIQLGNQAQVVAAQASVAHKEQVIGQVFLLNSAIQPQGERVTATQVRILATELEQALGGVFSGTSRELLIPVVRRVMFQMLQDGILLPEDDPATQSMIEELQSPDGVLGIRVRTGLEALSREVENEKMNGIMDRLIQMPERAQQVIIWPGVINRWLSTSGVEPTGMVMSVAEFQQQQAAEQQQQMAIMEAEQSMATAGRIAEQAAANQGVSQQ